MDTVEKIGTAVSDIKATWNNQENGTLNKIGKTAKNIKDRIDSVKEPIKFNRINSMTSVSLYKLIEVISEAFY